MNTAAARYWAPFWRHSSVVFPIPCMHRWSYYSDEYCCSAILSAFLEAFQWSFSNTVHASMITLLEWILLQRDIERLSEGSHVLIFIYTDFCSYLYTDCRYLYTDFVKILCIYIYIYIYIPISVKRSVHNVYYVTEVNTSCRMVLCFTRDCIDVKIKMLLN